MFLWRWLYFGGGLEAWEGVRGGGGGEMRCGRESGVGGGGNG